MLISVFPLPDPKVCSFAGAHFRGGLHSKKAAVVDIKVDANAMSKFNPPSAPNPPISIPEMGNLPPKTFVSNEGAIPPSPPIAFVSDAKLPVVIADRAPPTPAMSRLSMPKTPEKEVKAPTISPLSID